MSVLIKNIEMPSMCSQCPVMSDTGCCRADTILHKEELESLWTKKERPSWCPLIAIPPHGRLIDAKALLDDLIFPSKQFEQGMRELIGDAPTIIEAEGEA